MKVQINAFICYAQPDPWEKESHGFSVQSFDPTPYTKSKVLVGEQMIEVEVPENFDPRPQLVKALQAEKEKARKEFADKVMQIDRQINELLALEHTA
ncbi:hypothetical protein KBW71_03465 [Hydrogenophaga aromaticivorans]|uniref:hypothetical protein n=1 Tax=Hydrogenophaga aromaticivorans TaxID=2610898 RepID=UPI001B379054|nr:hypothetical protein [Hydrogenophaga aromaticivorans]MBQ0917488.1 hypothetical protein [Hydrogenophaga aromaticivorans]